MYSSPTASHLMPTRIDDLIHTSMKQMNSQQLSLIKNKQTQIST